MSDLFSATKSDAPDEEEDGELQFARCSQPASAEEKELPLMEPVRRIEADKKHSEVPTGGAKSPAKDDLALHRVGMSSPNVRRVHLTLRHMVVSLVFALIIGAVVLYIGWRTYQTDILPRLAPSAGPASPVTKSKTGEELEKAAGQITALQKQVDVMRREQLLLQQNTRESLERLSGAVSSSRHTTATETVPASGDPSVPRFADVRLNVSPTQEEFIQLKERNRLTQYADEAIATGMRRPLEVLVEYMRDPQAEHLHDAAQAEYMRAVRSIQLLQRDDPGYRLPVATLFKDGSIHDEADVKPDALLTLLADLKQPWEVRVRVCFLLLGSDLPGTNAALIKAVKEDPSLEVAKHAQLALEQRVKRRFRIFDIPAIEEWLKTQPK